MVKVVASARWYPTEDAERVRRCLLNIFPDEPGGAEVLVEWESGDRARFKAAKVRRIDGDD